MGAQTGKRDFAGRDPCYRPGAGVPAGELSQLFKPFYRVSMALERETGGTALGRAITHRVVRYYGGGVAARNRTGRGLDVEIRLPVVPFPVQQVPPINGILTSA